MVIFSNDEVIVTVMLGIDGPEPPREILRDVEASVEMDVNKGLNMDASRDSVTLTTTPNPSEAQRRMLGDSTLHVQQFDIQTGQKAIGMELVNAAHNTVVEKVDKLGFNIVGTLTDYDPID